MKRVQRKMRLLLMLFCTGLSAIAQETADANTRAVVPPLIKFSGTLSDGSGKPLTGVVGATFALYEDEQGGAPLWLETQNVQPDSRGHYTVMLGSTSSTGLPSDIFVAGEARWLAVQPQGQEEQARVLLLSVPYALKAGDAQTLGGLPASAFVQAMPPNGVPAAPVSVAATAPAPSVTSATSSNVTTTGGTVNAVPLFTTATNIQNSLLTQTGTSAINVGGKLNLFATGTATATSGKNSQPLNLSASAFNSRANAPVSETFQWQTEAAGNNTASPSGALHLLFGSGTTAPADTGLSIASNGQISFALGQTFSATSSASAGGVGVTGTTTGSGIGDYGVEGIATAAAGPAYGVYGKSASSNGFGVAGFSPNNVGVYGMTSGTSSTSYGVEGYLNALGGNGVGVYGSAGLSSAGIGVEGTSITLGVLGKATGASSFGVEGTSPNVAVFGNATGASGIGVDGHGALVGVKGLATAPGGFSGAFGGGPVSVAGNGNTALIGDPGCTTSSIGYAGIGFTMGKLSNCENYALLGDSNGGTYINSSGKSAIHFRNNNNNNTGKDLVTIDPAGDLAVAGKVSSSNVIAQAMASNTPTYTNCLGTLSAPNSNCIVPNMTLTKTTANPNVLVMVNIGGVSTDPCVTANFYLVVDNKIVALSSVSSNQNNSAFGFELSSVNMLSLQNLAAGSHAFQVQEADDRAHANCSTFSAATGVSQGDGGMGSQRTLIVREF